MREHGQKLVLPSIRYAQFLVKAGVLQSDRSHLAKLHQNGFVLLRELPVLLVGQLNKADVASIPCGQGDSQPAA